jgi:TRAP-type C4-dicarboxylate transport system permease small subunit
MFFFFKIFTPLTKLRNLISLCCAEYCFCIFAAFISFGIKYLEAKFKWEHTEAALSSAGFYMLGVIFGNLYFWIFYQNLENLSFRF